MNKEELNDDLEIGMESNDPEIMKSIVQSKKEIERGEIGTEEDIFKILRGRHK